MDTSCIPDVLGLRTRDADAAPVRILPGRALDCVRVLISDANVVDSGFHDVTLVDMADTVGPPVPKFKSSFFIDNNHITWHKSNIYTNNSI